MAKGDNYLSVSEAKKSFYQQDNPVAISERERERCHLTNVDTRRIPARRNTHPRLVNERDSPSVVDSAIADTLVAGISMRLRCIGTADRARTYPQPSLPDIGDPRICILRSGEYKFLVT